MLWRRSQGPWAMHMTTSFSDAVGCSSHAQALLSHHRELGGGKEWACRTLLPMILCFTALPAHTLARTSASLCIRVPHHLLYHQAVSLPLGLQVSDSSNFLFRRAVARDTT